MKKAYYFLLSILTTLSTSTMANNWMWRLPDNAYVAVLSIPGTHDSATGNGFSYSVTEPLGMYGNKYAKTQEYSVWEQWELGVRAFDLRPALYSDYININHGVMPTKLHFDTALYQLVELLKANPNEFAIIHLLHASDGDKVSGGYEERLLELLNRDDIRPFLADFRPDITVKEMRGKILILSRDIYDNTPIGGFFKNWSGSEEWYWQTQGKIVGSTTTATLYMQDYSDTHEEGGVAIKVNAMRNLLDFSTKHKTSSANDIVWVFNLTSAYSKMEKINIPLIINQYVSSSDGYRDNAYYTHTALLDYMAAADYTPGPLGIVLMDFAGADWSNDYNTRGGETVNAIIENNFRYLTDAAAYNETNVTVKKPGDMTGFINNAAFNADNLTSGWQGDSFGAVNGKENAEHYNHTFNTWQTISGLPNGVYAVSAKAFYRAGDVNEAFQHYRVHDLESLSASIYAVSGTDTMTQAIVSPFSAQNTRQRKVGREVKFSGGGRVYYLPDDMIAAEHYMHAVKAYYNNTVFVGVDDNTLTLGVKKDRFIGADWTIVDDFTLTYYGNTASAYANWLKQTTAQAETYSGITVSLNYLQNYQTALKATASNKAEAVSAMKAIHDAQKELAVNAGLWRDYKEVADSAIIILNDETIAEDLKSNLNYYYQTYYTTHLNELQLTNKMLPQATALFKRVLEQTKTDIATGIENLPTVTKAINGRSSLFTTDGKVVAGNRLRHGLYLIRDDNGRVRKVLK